MSIEERFWSKVDQGKSSDCWMWTGAILDCGYGEFKASSQHNTVVRSHRYAWQLTHGAIPFGLCVMHECDNRGCVNPNHLKIGTQGENIRDMVAKGRHRRTEVKLTFKDAEIIRKLYGTGEFTQKELGELYGVTKSQINHVVNYRRWN